MADFCVRETWLGFVTDRRNTLGIADLTIFTWIHPISFEYPDRLGSLDGWSLRFVVLVCANAVVDATQQKAEGVTLLEPEAL